MNIASVGKWLWDKGEAIGTAIRGVGSQLLEDEDGNLKFINRKNILKYGAITFVAIGCGIAAEKYFRPSEIATGGIDDYNQEASIGSPIREIENDSVDYRMADKLSRSSGGDYEKLLNKYAYESSNTPSTKPVYEKVLTAKTCDKLIKMASTGKLLTKEQKEDLEKCIEENISGLSEKQIKALKMLLDPNSDLTDKERALLAQFVNGEITDDDDPRLTLIDGLMSEDPNKRRAARLLINNDDLTDEERDRLLKFLKGEIGLDEVKDILKKKIKGVEDKQQVGQPQTNQGIKGVIDSINDLATKRKAVNKFIDDNRKRYNDIQKRISEGKEVSDEDLNFLDKYNAALKEKARLDKLLKSKKGLLARIQNDYNKSFMNAAKLLDLSNVEGIKIITHKPKKPKKSKSFSASLTPYELRKLGLEDGNYDKFKAIDASSFEVAEASTVVMATSESPNLELPSGLKLAAYTANAVYMKGGDSEYRLEVILLEDIYDYTTKKRLLPKGALLVGKVSTFDERTEIASATIEKAIVDGKSIPVKFIVTHNSGVPGIPGEVLSNRAEKLTAAVLTDTVTKFAESFVERAESQTDLESATFAEIGQLLGIQGAASTASAIADYLAKDLEDTPAIFLSPPRTRLILITD